MVRSGGPGYSAGPGSSGPLVTVVDRDPDQPVDDPTAAYETWHRPSVPQNLKPHSSLAVRCRIGIFTLSFSAQFKPWGRQVNRAQSYSE